MIRYFTLLIFSLLLSNSAVNAGFDWNADDSAFEAKKTKVIANQKNKPQELVYKKLEILRAFRDERNEKNDPTRKEQLIKAYQELKGKDLVSPLARTLQEYLLKYRKPILLLGCGHPTESEIDSARGVFQEDVYGSRHFHTHKGAFTINLDPKMFPDLCDRITPSLLTRLADNGGAGQFHLVWEEYLTSSVLADESYTDALYKLLENGGHLVFKEKSEIKFVESVKSKFKTLRLISFDVKAWCLKKKLINKKMITSVGNGDWDYSKVNLEEPLIEKEVLCGKEDWDELKKSPSLKLSIEKGFVFLEGDLVYQVTEKWRLSQDSLEKMKLNDESRKILSAIDPTLETYPSSVYIAQKE